MSSETPLPPGQAPAALRRFGLPEFARPRVRVPEHPVITISGAVRRPTQWDVRELTALPGRTEVTSDLHCVTTWSARDLSWQGLPFRVVHDFLTARVEPHPSVRWVSFTGLDGYRSALRIEDALASNVLLADTLDGGALTSAHGAPIRLVAPAHYGYKGVKHVCAIEYHRRYDSGSAGWKAHRRGRVDLEERSGLLPGRWWRPLWRALAPRVRAVYERVAEDGACTD